MVGAGLSLKGAFPPFSLIVSFMGSFNYKFRDPALLEEALTHKSVNRRFNYERLEFLGDSLLNFFITRFLLEEHSSYSLSELAQAKRYIVSNEFLRKMANKLNLQVRSKRRFKDGYLSGKVMADALEALFAAVFLDGGLGAAYTVFKEVFAPEINRVLKEQAYRQDYKTMLLMLCKEKFQTAPTYRILGVEGVNVIVECKVKDIKEIAEGFDLKTAEQNCAKKLYLRLKSL
ncbi:MAG: ribonuclease III domain-containing protein [Nitrososphaerales archaeon]